MNERAGPGTNMAVHYRSAGWGCSAQYWLVLPWPCGKAYWVGRPPTGGQDGP